MAVTINDFLGVNQETDSYTLTLDDAWQTVEISKATAVNLTVPLNSSVAFPVNTRIWLKRTGVGQMTVVATGGVTITASATVLTDPGLNVEMMLRKTGTDTWDLQNGSSAGQYTDYVPTHTGFSANPTSIVCRYALIGKVCHFYYNPATGGTSNATGYTITLPFNAKKAQLFTWSYAQDGSATATVPGLISLGEGSNIATLYKTTASGAWSATNVKRAIFSIAYEIE